MTDEDEPVRHGPPPGYDADEAAFISFSRGYRPLGDDLRGASGNTLGSHTALDVNTFSRVGRDVGLADAVSNATRRQFDRINGLATNSTTMVDAVDQTLVNYRSTEDAHDRAIRKAAGELA